MISYICSTGKPPDVRAGGPAIDTTVGYIGLGTMGRAMASNVARAGFDLVVFDVRSEAYAPLEALGAKGASSPREVAESVDVVLVNVVNEAQVRSVLLGDDGVLDALRPGGAVVVHSTIHPAGCRELAAEARRRHIGFLDAPFSGGAAAAENGTLALIVGGTTAVLEQCRPVLDAMAATVFHVGEHGMGEAAKITNNAVLSVILQATQEGLQLSRASGIDDDVMLSILCASSGASWVSSHWRAIEQTTAAYPGGASGMADLVTKDLNLALAIAHDVGVPLPAVALTTQFVDAAYHRLGDSAPAS
jgi:3-hydroxyisobutyrate dehydrogenase-like beta-hydroxyacid dehydrogenase